MPNIKATKKMYELSLIDVILLVQSLMLYRYPVDFTNFFGSSIKKFYLFENEEIRTCWHHCQNNFVRVRSI